jgi:hypothetical protein
MAETVKKAAAKAKETAEGLSKAVTAARTRTGTPKVTKAPPTPKEPPAAPVNDPVTLLDAFITHETSLRDAIAFPDDTGDQMYAAVTNYLYYTERITKAQLVQKHLKEG